MALCRWSKVNLSAYLEMIGNKKPRLTRGFSVSEHANFLQYARTGAA